MQGEIHREGPIRGALQRVLLIVMAVLLGVVVWQSTMARSVSEAAVVAGSSSAGAAPVGAAVTPGQGQLDDSVQMPDMAAQAMIAASLEAMAENGVIDGIFDERDTGLTGPAFATGDSVSLQFLPILHFIDCTEDACAAVSQWAETNGLESSGPLTNYGHGGVEEFYVELGEEVTPSPAAIAGRVEAVVVGIAGVSDAVYSTWMVNNRSVLDGGE